MGMSIRKDKLYLLIASLLLLISVLNQKKIVNADTVKLSNPVIQSVDYMESGQKVTYDCIYFGSYPQAEVLTKKISKNYAVTAEILTNKDLIIDDVLYKKLSSKKCSWNDSNETVIDGVKYRRVKASEISRIMKWDKDFDGGYIDQPDVVWQYNWRDKKTYHYFCYEPIKWRVLQVDDSVALLLSDLILDSQEYNTKLDGKITYETCSLRKWMNTSFLDTAFDDIEKAMIKSTQIEYPIKYGSSEKAYVEDKVFLLSGPHYDKDFMEEYPALDKYGFGQYRDVIDSARACRSSTYAKAMGTNFEYNGKYAGNSDWYVHDQWVSEVTWIVTGEKRQEDCGYVSAKGIVGNPMGSSETMGFRACVRIDLNNSNLWKYAGAISSDFLSNGQEIKDDISGAYYRVTAVDNVRKCVTYLNPINKKENIIIIPDTVILQGNEYNVDCIETNAFKNNKKIKQIIVGNNVKKY